MHRKLSEIIIEGCIRLSGVLCIGFVVLIFLFLLKDALSLFGEYSPVKFLFGSNGFRCRSRRISGSFRWWWVRSMSRSGRSLICVPIGVGAAMFIAEIAPQSLKTILKSLVEILAAIPSVVLGFIGIVWLGPFLKTTFHLSTGMCGLTGSLLLAFMALPTIISISEDALVGVPRAYREAAFGLGATRWQTLWRILLPAASSGIIAGVMLGIGRVIGETMVVMMVTGNAPMIPLRFCSRCGH